MNYVIAAVLLATSTAFVTSAAVDPTTYTNSTELVDGVYTLFWRIERSAIYRGLEDHTTGWFGFGFGEPSSGSMIGSDMLVSEVDELGRRVVWDAYATAFATPHEDACQDWELISYAFDERRGVSSLEVVRALDTGETQQDRVVMPGPTRIVYAWGTGNSISYHKENVGTLVLMFIPSTEPELPDASTMPGIHTTDATMGYGSLIDADTLYMCHSLELPTLDRDHHVVQMDPIIDPVTEEFVHHLFIHVCKNVEGGYVSRYSQPSQCLPPQGDFSSGCDGFMYAWAPGVTSLKLPVEAGVRLGPGENAAKYVVVEVHYNRPQSGFYDNSGARLWYTPDLRTYDVGTLTLGDALLRFAPIPPEVKDYHYEAECPASCTSRFAHPINIFASFQHMHYAGIKLWTAHWDANGNKLGYVDRVEYYDYNFQTFNAVNVTLNPGDRLNTHCTVRSGMRTFFKLLCASTRPLDATITHTSTSPRPMRCACT